MMGEKRVFGTAEYHYIQKGFYMDQIERFLAVFPDRSADLFPPCCRFTPILSIFVEINC